MSDLEQIVKDDFTRNGFDVLNIIADGKIHRFKKNSDDKKRDAWYACFINHDGRSEFLAGIYGDWRDSDRYTFCTNISLSTDKKEKIFKKAEKQFEAAQLERWDEAAQDCKIIWDSFTVDSGMHAYLVRKKIKNLFGARISKDGKNLIIPVRDIDGKMWGFQSIDEEGGKLFHPGTKKKGNFFSLGEIVPRETIYICEGFATGCDIHEAIQKPVLVCFDAGNLVEVARVIREKYPDIILVVCGDNDVFTDENPGKKKAQEAAAVGLGTFVLPQFKNLASKPTDFNDLRIVEGLDAVREQILGADKKRFYVKCLGYHKGTYFYRTSSNLEITRVTQHSEESLLNLMPFEFWESQYRKDPKKPMPWTQIKSDLMNQCRNRGIYDRELVRGLGVWDDNGKIIVHLGNRLYYDGSEHEITSLKSEYHYELSRTLPSVHPDPLTIEECEPIISALSVLNYKGLHQRYFLGGWIAIASLCGLLKWRPHLWLTGQTGSGKSEIRNRIVVPLIKNGLHALNFVGDSTEPGIRRTVLSHALPVIFDEVESDDHHANEAVQRTLRYIRQASTEQEGQIVKAGSGSSTDCYSARFVSLLSSVEANLKHQADKDRFTVVEIVREGQSNEQYKEFLKRCNWFTVTNAQRFLARCVKMAPVLQKNHKILQETSVGSQRFGAQYGALLAGWSILTSDDEITKPQAEQLWASVDWSEDKEEPTDGESCLNELLSHIIRLPDGERSIRQLINSENSNVRDHLIPYQIRVLDTGDVFIAKHSPQVARLFQRHGSRWIGENRWYKTILRLPGVISGSHRVMATAPTCRGLVIPSKYFKI